MYGTLLYLFITGLIFAPTISYTMNTTFKMVNTCMAKVRVTQPLNNTPLQTFPWTGSDAHNAGKGLLGGIIGGGVVAKSLSGSNLGQDFPVAVQNVTVCGWPFSLLAGGPAGVVSFLGTAVVMRCGLAAQQKHTEHQKNFKQ
jgi:hypothetical protein